MVKRYCVCGKTVLTLIEDRRKDRASGPGTGGGGGPVVVEVHLDEQRRRSRGALGRRRPRHDRPA